MTMLVSFASWGTVGAQQAPAAPPQAAPAAPAQQAAAGQPAKANLSSSLGLYVYPAKNQDAAQQNEDESNCYGWAKQQTGIDPVAGTPVDTAKATEQQGGAVRGAARGAAAGALIGAAAGDAGTGAAVGAAAGGVGGRRRQKGENAASEQQAQQANQQAAATQKQTFQRAFAACMQPKGYTIQ
jgi:hypothetical protein